MEKTYQILVTLNLRSKESAKDAVYAYLRELIDDDSLHFESVDRVAKWAESGLADRGK